MGVTGVYNHGKFTIARGLLPLDTSDIRVLLVSSGYTYSASHNFVSDLSSEVSGVGYARKALLNKVVLEDDVLNLATFDADDVTWVSASFASVPDAAILYLESGSDLSRVLLCSVNINPKLPTTGANYVVQFNSSGILILSG